jgi:hypothetical protein
MSYDNRGATEHQVGQWVRDQVLAKKLECKELVLRHVTMDSRPQGDVASYDIPVGDLTPAHDVDTIVGQVMESAQADADSVGGSVQMYALYATFKNSDHVFRKVFRVSPQTDFERDVKPSEPPTNEGLAGQAMRHLEAVMKTSVASQGYLFSLLERQLQRLQDKDERSDQQKLDMMMLVQEVIDGSHTRRLAERKEEASQGMKENALEYLKVAAPIILNRLAGKPLFPEKNKSPARQPRPRPAQRAGRGTRRVREGQGGVREALAGEHPAGCRELPATHRGVGRPRVPENPEDIPESQGPPAGGRRPAQGSRTAATGAARCRLHEAPDRQR